MGQSQDGAISGGPPTYGARDNANMGTGADGQHPSTNMFLWQPLPGAFYAPCVDGDYDVTVFAHEFGHAVENRMIGKGVGARQGFPAGAMGEAFGDMNALEFVNESHIAPVPGADRYTEGAYVTGNGVQRHPRLPRGPADGRPVPAARAEPRHRSAELQRHRLRQRRTGGARRRRVSGSRPRSTCATCSSSGTRRAATAEDLACLRGQKSSNTCPGDRRWMQLYFDAMVMMPRNPTMQDARDAQLAADMARFGGANQDLLWQGFALRGLGQFAQTNPNVGTGGNAANADTDPTPDFSSPLANNATLTFFADSKGNSLGPRQREDLRGRLPGPLVQIADTDPSTNPDGTPRTVNLDNTAQFVPNLSNPRWSSYNFTAVAPGYGMVRFNVRDLRPGETGTSRSTSPRTSPRRRRARRSPATRSGRTRTSPTSRTTTRPRTTARPARTPRAAGS